MWERRIDFLCPVDAAARLRPLGRLAFLDSAMPHPTLGRHAVVAASPFAVLRVDADGAAIDGGRLAGPPLAALRAAMRRYRTPPAPPGGAPFRGGAVGFIAYDFARHLERLDRPADLEPEATLAEWGLYDTVLALDLAEETATLFSSGFARDAGPESPEAERRARAQARLDAFAARLAEPAEPAAPLPPIPAAAWRPRFDAAGYHAAVERVRELILAGDIYQANIAQGFCAALPEGFDPFSFYRRLREANPAPFAAYLETPSLAIASSSPERFLKLEGAAVETRPIKGTAARHPDPAEDRRRSEALLASDKDRAENVMIVDLLRNDLSRVCRADSVEVPVLCGLETYASVHHLVSAVTGILREGADAFDLLAAAFPGGSITGAPKIRAMDVITAIEREARGVYCGSIGHLGFDGAMDLNIAIRTVAFGRGEARFQAGGGITILSDPEAEHAESLAKATRIFAAFERAGPP